MRNDRPHRKVVDFIMSHIYSVKQAGCKDKCEIEGSHMVGGPVKAKPYFYLPEAKLLFLPSSGSFLVLRR